MSNTNPARGMRDFLPDTVRKRNYVIGIIREVYEKYGFEPLETPTIENLSTLTNKYGEEGDQLMFKILKRGEKLKKQLKRDEAKENDLTDLALRYDLTVPLARVIANSRNELPRFFKRYQIQPVWRADRPARGRYREFYQCDVDAIGSKSMLVEAELCAAVCEILERLGFEDFELHVNHRAILKSILESAGIDSEKHSDALVALDKLDKIGFDGVRKEFTDRKLSTSALDSIQSLYTELSRPQSIGSMLVILSKFNKTNCEMFQEKTKEIRQIFDYSNSPNLKLNISLARGLSYYTGAIFEVVLTNGDFKGSICGGGRYDGLIGMFGKEEIPAVGLSLGLERILLVMEERGMFRKLIDEGKLEINAADVLVTVWNEESVGESLKLANELRMEDLRVLVYPQADKLGKQFKYANQIDVEYVCVLGDTELAENTVQVKNMKTGEQENVAREEIAEKITKT